MPVLCTPRAQSVHCIYIFLRYVYATVNKRLCDPGLLQEDAHAVRVVELSHKQLHEQVAVLRIGKVSVL